MATQTTDIATIASADIAAPVIAPMSAQTPRLEVGDHLTRDEFERRYATMPDIKKAELIEGVVFMAAAVRYAQHGHPHGRLMAWLGIYEAHTAGVSFADNTTVRLDTDNEFQPDGLLLIEPQFGGQSSFSDDGYVEGPPELAAEVASSSVSIDRHTKFRVYRRNGVREYIVWRVLDQEIDWFVLEESEYRPLPSASDELLKSRAFPGLWLDRTALLAGDMAKVLAVAQQGVASPEHAAFVESLRLRKPAH